MRSKKTGFLQPSLLPAEPKPPPWRILITGDRNWDDLAFIEKVITTLGRDRIVYVVHGDCGVIDNVTGMPVRGADKMAGWVCRKWGIPCHAVPAMWGRYGKAAGPIRNQSMLDRYLLDVCIAFHDDITKSTGTKDMVGRAHHKGLELIFMRHGVAIPEFRQ